MSRLEGLLGGYGAAPYPPMGMCKWKEGALKVCRELIINQQAINNS